MIVFACPGQGSQTPGFLTPWIQEAEAHGLLQHWSEVIDVDLIEHGTVSDADTIRATEIAQPLIVAAGLLAAHRLRNVGVTIEAAAGHSVGEFTAAAISSILSEEDALRLVRARAVAMAEASAAVPTGMSAVIGGEQDSVVAHAASFGLEAANFNAGGQIVVAGSLEALEKLAAEPLRGTRVVPLKVAGAFHTSYMASAREAVRAAAASLSPQNPAITIWTNRDGSVVSSGSDFLELLIDQVSNPVRWDLDSAAFLEAGIQALVELPPCGALVGLAKRGLKGVPTVALGEPDDVSTVLELQQGL